MTINPYQGLEDHHFWRRAVAGTERFRFDPVVQTRFIIQKVDKVATAGSCFAQHISNRLSKLGFNYLVTETGDDLSDDERRALNYGVFSARFGNIYTPRQLLQLFEACFENRQVAEDVWQRSDGRYVDALRPQITSHGHESVSEVRSLRRVHLAAVRRMFRECDVFIFTLGLTEAWRSRLDGTTYPLAPGVAGGSFDPDRHEFINFDVHDVLEDMRAFLKGLQSINPMVKIILTVSPVPLIATYEARNVLVSTTYSKSVLRVAADMLCRENSSVEYFPSYEIITGNYNDSLYYEADYRGINSLGVDHAMRCFLAHYTEDGNPISQDRVVDFAPLANGDVICDEEAIERVRVAAPCLEAG